MNADFWCHGPSVFGHSITSLLKIMAVVLMVLSVARCVRMGNYRAAVATLVLNAIAFVTELQAVVLFFLPVHYYFNVYLAAPRPRVVDFGRAPRLR